MGREELGLSRVEGGRGCDGGGVTETREKEEDGKTIEEGKLMQAAEAGEFKVE